eukprot:bmy_19861T0
MSSAKEGSPAPVPGTGLRPGKQASPGAPLRCRSARPPRSPVSNLEASDILVAQRHLSQDKESVPTCSRLLFPSPTLRSQPPTTRWVETPAASGSGVTGGWLGPALFCAVTQPPCRARGSFATCGRAAHVRSGTHVTPIQAFSTAHLDGLRLCRVTSRAAGDTRVPHLLWAGALG